MTLRFEQATAFYMNGVTDGASEYRRLPRVRPTASEVPGFTSFGQLRDKPCPPRMVTGNGTNAPTDTRNTHASATTEQYG